MKNVEYLEVRKEGRFPIKSKKVSIIKIENGSHNSSEAFKALADAWVCGTGLMNTGYGMTIERLFGKYYISDVK